MRGSLAGRAGRAATVAVTLCWMLAALLAPGTRAALAQGATGIPGLQTESTAQVEFGAEIRFQLQAQSDEPITSVLFLYQVDDSPVQNTGVPSYRPGTSVDAIYSWRVANVLVPGTEIRYRWQVETASGRRATTKEQLVAYDDTRFNWQTVKGDLVTVYYPSSDPQAGQALLEEAGKAQGRLRREYGLSLDKPLRIFAYTGREEYASALYTGQPLDVATTVGTDRIFVLAPGGTSGMTVALQGLRRELATALFLQKTRNPYADPPLWLAEGFSYVMSGEELLPETYQALGQLAEANQLLPLRTLNGSFPTTERDLTLAYAESASAVKYIADAYGPQKLQALLAAFKEGNTVDDALKKGLGVSLDQLETRWKNALKNGTAARPSAGQGSPQGAPRGDGGVVDRLFGPALSYWQGLFGEYTRPVLIGMAGVIGLGIVALVVGTGVSIWRRNHDEEY